MKKSIHKRTTFLLAEPLRQHLNMYAVAASAAGVGLLALAHPAEAKIVYTAVHKTIGSETFLDLNHDGINDFKFITTHTSRCEGVCTTTPGFRHATAFQASYGKLAAYGVRNGNQIYGQGKFASALPAGVTVGPKGKFPGGNLMATASAISNNNEHYGGPWAGPFGGGGVKHHYLGFKFVIKGQTHFGWARLDVTMSAGAHVGAVITGYAYETIPNKPIVTGKTKGRDVAVAAARPAAAPMAPVREPATLGLLAMGSPALSIWRRKIR